MEDGRSLVGSGWITKSREEKGRKVRKERREEGGRKGRRKKGRRVRREGDPQWKLITVRHTYCEMLPRSLS